MSSKGVILVFSAASGAGKSTILDALVERMSNLVYSISATTRKPRGKEKDGVEYYFMTRTSFEKKVEEGGFVEWAEVHGNLYGTPKDKVDALLAEGKTVLMDIDVQGKSLIDKVYPDAKGVYIEAPSMEELEQRLRSRGTDSDEAIAIRLENAVKENEYARFEGKYDYFVVNDKLEDTIGKVERIVEQIQQSTEK